MLPALLLVALFLQANAGVAPAWDAAKLFTAIIAQSQRLEPVLLRITPGDRPAVVAALKDNRALVAEAQAVAKMPEKLSDSLRLLEHIHTVEEEVAALLPGVAHDQNPALAELIAGIQAEGKSARDAYGQRVMDLAGEREEQLSVADHEAQRCRAILSREPHGGGRTVR